MTKNINRNDPCHCGSGKKYKSCHMEKDNAKTGSKIGMIVLAVAIVLGIWLAGAAIFGGDGASRNCPPGTTWDSAHQHCH